MNISHCLSSPCPGFNSQPWRPQPWLITFYQPVLSQRGRKWLNLPSMTSHNLWKSRSPRGDNDWKMTKASTKLNTSFKQFQKAQVRPQTHNSWRKKDREILCLFIQCFIVIELRYVKQLKWKDYSRISFPLHEFTESYLLFGSLNIRRWFRQARCKSF